jgi:transporter family protein
VQGTILAVFAAICWGIAPIAAKMALRSVSPVIGMGVRSAIAAGMVSVWLFTTGSYRQAGTLGGRSLVWLTVEALLATVVGDAAYFYALKHGQAGQVSLIMAASPLVTLTVATMLLGEPISLAKWLGATLIIGGLFLITF